MLIATAPFVYLKFAYRLAGRFLPPFPKGGGTKCRRVPSRRDIREATITNF